MSTMRKDLVATVLMAAVVLVFLATLEGWGVPFVGDSHRWAAAVILVLGIAACAQGSPSRDAGGAVAAMLGAGALALGVVAAVTGSLTALSLLVLCNLALWAVATVRHHRAHAPHGHGVAT